MVITPPPSPPSGQKKNMVPTRIKNDDSLVYPPSTWKLNLGSMVYKNKITRSKTTESYEYHM